MDRSTTDEPNTPRVSSGSTDFPPSQHSANRSSYASWTTEENKILLTGYYHFSNDSELGVNQKGDTFWGKIAGFVNENAQGGVERTPNKCQSHFRDINRKISSFVSSYSTATKEKHSGWSEDDYVGRALQLYHEQRGTKFNLIEEWKLVRNQPKYMTGVTKSGSSGSKRKSGSDNVESVDPPMVRPEGRDAAKKKARLSSSKSSASRKTKFSFEDEFSNLASARENFEQSRASTVAAMLEYAAGQKESAHARMWDIEVLGKILKACIILHNMIVEDERDTYSRNWEHIDDFDQPTNASSSSSSSFDVHTQVLPQFEVHVQSRSSSINHTRAQIRDRAQHIQLKKDLVEHIWQKFGETTD